METEGKVEQTKENISKLKQFLEGKKESVKKGVDLAGLVKKLRERRGKRKNDKNDDGAKA